MKLRTDVLCLLLVLIGHSLWAEERPQDPIDAHVFAPELVMQHQRAIALSEEQRDALKAEIRKAQSRFTDLQWDLQDEMETFLTLLSQQKIDEQKAVAQLEKILKIESEVKRTHLTLAIRIKNILTAEQQERLQQIKKNQ